MTDAPDGARSGEFPGPEGAEPEGAEPNLEEPGEPGLEAEPGAEPGQPGPDQEEPGGPEEEPGEPGAETPPEASTPKRRRSRNRGRRRHRPEGGLADEGADGSGAVDQGLAGNNRLAGSGRPTEHVPATYGALEAAFFDLDKTVIAKASMVAFGRPFYNGGLINRRTVLRAVYGELIYLHLGASEQKLNQIRESILRLIKGWHSDRVREIVAEAIEAIVEPIIFAEAADLIDWHHEHGRLVVIVSASPEEIVTPLSRFLGADECIASRARVDDQGRYTGTMQFYAFGPFKAEAMDALAAERGIDLAASYAYTDSYTDLPMLEAVGHPVAVNPDRVLNRYAREHDFEVLHFSQTVSLWSRVRDRLGAVPPRPAIAVSAGAVALGVGAAAAGWWLGSRRRSS
ncbi:MAG: HAD family hydrolase [Acidimicrobiales bacterium]